MSEENSTNKKLILIFIVGLIWKQVRVFEMSTNFNQKNERSFELSS